MNSKDRDDRSLQVKAKEWVFDNYLGVGVATALLSLLVVLLSARGNRMVSGATALGGLLGFFYFVQRQRLEELNLFRRLFTDFNARYEALNDPLRAIKSRLDRMLTDSNIDQLNAYFNLCGEEYFFYRQGIIPKTVWWAWVTGMREWAKCAAIGDRWKSELKDNSYYGFRASLIGLPEDEATNSPEEEHRGRL